MKTKPVHYPRRRRRLRWTQLYALGLVFCLVFTGCFNEEPSTYYGKIVPQRVQEFRWSDGGLPQTFDPAFAAAPPDTDVVRALFEGLTDYDPQTLAPIPAVATRWESSNEGRVWTFYLRQDARWSNGEKVTATDFVRSWQRTLKIGPLAPHTELLTNIEGATATESPTTTTPEATPHFGARAIGEHVLQVTLAHADSDFPSLVAHPVFRPVKLPDAEHTEPLKSHELISNGAFQLSATEADRVRLERAKNYWDESSVALDRVTFVNTPNPEDALSAYRAGEIDAVTNAAFEPLALKLLAPYKDFRRSTFGALTYYVFNVNREPFDDVRVREALALAIDRERISRIDLGGATEPAGTFLPEAMSGEKPVVEKAEVLDQDVNRARELLAQAGYPNGENFPVLRLLINRNEQQRIVAQSIATMWRTALNIETEIVIKAWDEYDAAIKAGDYDVVRRGLVMQTTSEPTNIAMLFGRDSQPTPAPAGTNPETNGPLAAVPTPEPHTPLIETEAQALKELKAMPIYFASSYSLVKPYVSGFDRNVLDAPLLKRTRLDTNWSEQAR
ncbi:MAG TPA: peptide ABC transporter substrate-binding protein [Pyrinomonadaceae bacterium]|nr:peptide ABC transporter substrate-binding protein [Pyrinomonadaceae bacterium]